MTAPPGPEAQPTFVTGDANAPLPKITELRVEAIHADGTRVYLTYLPDPDGHLRVRMEDVEDDPPEITSRSLLTFHRRRTHQRLDIEGVGTWRMEHLVRPG